MKKFKEYDKTEKIIVIAFVVFLGLCVIGSLSNNSSTIAEKPNQEEQVEQVNNTDTIDNKDKEDKVTLKLSDGTFKVGKDLDPGTYLLVKHDNEFMGSYDITTDTTGDIESMVDSNAFENFNYIEVKDGQYIQLDKCALYIPDEIPLNISELDELTNGMFIVGKDINVGEYKLEAIDGDQGWYSLYNNLAGGYKGGPDLQDSDTFSGSKLITLKDGQYIRLDSNTKIVK